ncbi:MAG: 60S ribosomal protein L31 [Nitrososphaerales archaeon]|nr:60S ribosomal protein L31 [Nitrososphaerales archaeon]
MSEQKKEPLTRVYNVPLGVVFEAAPYRRAKVAIRVIREFTVRHMKADEIKIKEDVNRRIWARGMKHPPRRIRLEMERDEDGLVTIGLAPEASKV